jgi:hypothetical protein
VSVARRVLVFGAAIAAIVVTAPAPAALAARPAGGAIGHGRLVAAAPGHPSVVAPIDSSYLEVAVPGLPATLAYSSNSVVSSTGPNSLGITMILQNGVSYTATLTLQPGQVVTAGTVYTDEVPFTISVSRGSSQVCNATGGLEFAQVDQLQRNGSGVPTTAAFQFLCVSGNGTSYGGAFSYMIVPTTPGQGYYTYEATGLITGFGNDNYLIYLGDLSAETLDAPIVGMAITPDGGGYWLVAADGGMFAFGDAHYYGSMGGKTLNEPIVGMSATPDGGGYYLVASDGGIFAFGNAPFYGSMGGKPLNKPIVGIAADPAGNGYWEVASDGGIFSFGPAPFYGSTGNITLNKPVVGMTPTANGKGYWFVATDGGIFAYGDAAFHGSTGSLHLAAPIVGMATASNGAGYWLVASDGGIFAFNVPFYGSFGGEGINDVVGLAT